jgi:hypothetical protein
MLRKIGSRMIEITLTFLFLRGKAFCVPEFLKSPGFRNRFSFGVN